MNSLICPRCKAELIEDAWEDVREKPNGDFVVNAYPAYVCRNKCGYLKEIESVPEVIGQQGDDRLLLLYPNEQGRILEIRNRVLWPPMHYQSILGRGYWEEYTGNHVVEQLLETARDSRAVSLELPNLFQYATSELSQDAFLCWLMAWSEEPYRSLDRPLHEAAVDFMGMIFNAHNLPVPVIESISIQRQFKALDILVIVNDTYAILIEDKTFTKDHSNQLARYRAAVKAAYPDLVQLPIYYKIADQSHYRSLESPGYIPFKRKMMLEVLQRGKQKGVQNPIFLDYLHYLEKIEEGISSFRVKPVKEWNHYAWQGFYQELQKEINGNWGYVPNPSGGFWAFWWVSASNKAYFLQLQQQRLCVKISPEEGENKREIRMQGMKDILAESEKRNLLLKKPARLGSGRVMTIAQRDDYLQTTSEGLIDIKRTIEELKKY
ncbi:PD-(D/E)XK nuclease superfamily protein [Cytobacillus oceanisediminis]|uniref:PD-(D/E)XK nuclease superfamily protein n=1 Tax=Cytobacillus oceanisediminis TaxID=665099 RepID=A0A2V3A3V0_9BACI|nr:PD-(D/E)XK nuclease family protein [Cytobacillus oceanisediminis]PWW31392.1 PD-(D/E)XK nuclease superfamily protein [Cytobacillus oceanisediminis]